LAAELGWSVGELPAALACDIVNCITPGSAIVVERDDLRPGQHLNMLGADGSGKAEASLDAVVACELFCDEWEQASHGGELAGAVAAGRVTREQVTALGAVLAGDAAGRSGPDATTLFDSTGLAIQDLAVAAAALRAAQSGVVEAGRITL
jgi:ornithine cyclodeaminase/alanine dehydrogenase-like protein (mu-crystallin family)